jgi:hypothetical protein
MSPTPFERGRIFADGSVSWDGGKHMTLKSIDEHNTKIKETREAAQMSGIACPSCGLELKWNNTALMSYPPRRGVECSCGWSGVVD